MHVQHTASILVQSLLEHSLPPPIELVWLGHQYTSNLEDTAAVCVNAGTCLEDGNLYHLFNAYDTIGKAVEKVGQSCHKTS